MADVTGPISSLPGSFHVAPKGSMCDDHSDRPAVRRVQGETDSMGSEMHDLCQSCFDQLQTAQSTPLIAICDWCKTTAELRPMRDFEEGRNGPVYDVCIACSAKHVAQTMDTEEEDFVYNDYDPYDD